MHKSRRRLSQNFLHSHQLVSKLVGLSSIGSDDTVLEIGSGRGIITHELAKNSKHVLSIELDKRLSSRLITSLADNVTLFTCNALDFPLPSTRYKVFANPPFSIEGKLLRKLLDADNPPEELSLVVRQQHALRWTGKYKSTAFSRKYGVRYDLNIIHHFQAYDFKPKTKVKAVMISIKKKENF